LADRRVVQRTLVSEVPVELRRALAAELRRLSPRIPEALAEISVPLYVVDRQGTIRWLNAAAIEVFGDRKGEHYSVVVAPDAHQLTDEQFARKIVGSSRVTAYPSALLARDGRRFEVEIESVRLEDDAEIMGVFGAIEMEKFADPLAAAKVHLTPRQLQVLKLLAGGYSTDSIASELHLSRATVRNHVRDLLKALGEHSRLHAVMRARELGIV
jgi:PAS domain S-box-containing protein